ncbi:ATP-binding cassette sub-family G member 2-like [Balamuthia mandrillaris]
MSSIGTSSSSSSDPLSEGEEHLEEHAGGSKEEQLASSVLGDEELGVVSKYAKVNQPCPFSGHTPKHPISLEWRNLNYKVVIPKPPENLFLRLLLKLPIPAMLTEPLKTKIEVPILNNVSGKVAPGNVIAIMGPTGSGKTTLLNVLARRVKMNVTGDILVNGEEVSGRRFKRRMAYVLQDDLFFPNLTVRDTVTYTALLKLPKDLSPQAKRERVDEVLTELGLQRCSNTIIGGAFVRGISGGERKRTNIANELVNNPSLIFLDEPTSGLDAATSLGLIVSLKNLAKSGHTVVTTIHQPSSAMFMMFDNVILLAEGGFVVYSGSAAGVLPYFASLGLHSPSNYNPADFMLEVVTSDEKTSDGRTVRQLLIDNYAEEFQKDSTANGKPLKIEEEMEEGLVDMKKGAKYPTGMLQQTWVLANRAFKQRRHDILSWMNVIQMLLISLLSGFIWFQMDKDESAIPDRTGFLFFSTMFWILHPWMSALYGFPPERAVLNKERATGNYRLSSYFIGKMIAETPLQLLLPFMFACITYWMVGLSDDGYTFIFYIVILWLFVLLGDGIGTFIGATIVNIKTAMTMSIIIMLGSVLLGGFFVSRENLAVWVAWARWLSIVKYSYELALLNEFELSSDLEFTPSNPSTYTSDPITGDDVIDHLNVETNVWGDIIFLVGMIIVSRVAAYFSLRFLNKPRQ